VKADMNSNKLTCNSRCVQAVAGMMLVLKTL